MFSQQLAFAEAVEHHGHGAHFHAMRAEPDQMRVDPLQFGEQHADVLDALPELAGSTPRSFSTDMQKAMLLDCALR